MKLRNLCLLFFFIIGIVSCNNTDINQPTQTSSGDIIPHTWMKLEIVNNTNEDVSYDMSVIDITFDVSNDCRSDVSVDIWLRNFWSFTVSDKFESLFEQELADKTLYKNYYDPTGDIVFEDMSYNPIDDYYEWDLLEDVIGNLQGNTSKKYYCWNITKGRFGVSAIYSVLCKLTVGDKKFVLPGWDQSLYKYDVSTDTIIADNLEIYKDDYNPQNETNSEWSPSLKCDCYELTITINGDTSSDIVITKNCINPWNE